jgi:hypothetical protein
MVSLEQKGNIDLDSMDAKDLIMSLASCPSESRDKVSLVEKFLRALFLTVFLLPLISLAAVGLSVLAVNTEIITPRLGSLIAADASALAGIAVVLIVIACFVVAIPQKRLFN